MSKTIYLFSHDGKPFVLNKFLFQDFQVKTLFFNKLDNHATIKQGLACTPGRYMEHFLNDLELADDRPILLLNPLVTHESVPWLEFLTELASRKFKEDKVQYVTDLIDRPVGIYLPQPKKQLPQLDIFWFRFLSLQDTAMDVQLLNMTQKVGFDMLQLNTQVNYISHVANGFYLLRYQNIYKLMTQHAINYVKDFGSQNPKATAVLPFHAGDLLFFAKAAAETKHNFKKILVNHEYADILKKMNTELEILSVPDDSLGRGRNKNGQHTLHNNLEFEYFHHVIHPYLKSNELFYFFRPVRRYSHCKFHLVDQFKYALSNEKFEPVRAVIPTNLPALAKAQKKIMIHFDGGWHLKIFPYENQLQLIAQLQKQGYTVTVLTNLADSYPCNTVKFENLESLTQQILSNDILLGMDSFPVHYATHVLKHPTICAFSSTQAENSDNAVYDRYDYAIEDLTCCPCDAADICPVFGKTNCANFSSADKIYQKILKMSETCYGAQQ